MHHLSWPPLLALLLGSGPALGQAGPVNMPSPAVSTAASSPIDQRAADLVDLLAGRAAYATYFDDLFKANVPESQFAAISAQLIQQYGQPQAVESLERKTADSAIARVRFERGIGRFALQIGAGPDHRVVGLRILGFEVAGDNFDRIAADLAALPGETGYLVAEIKADQIHPIAGAHVDRQIAIGSTFKLYVLDELVAQIGAGKWRWDNVVPLSHQSFSSLGTNGWQAGTPVTIHSLANWMISVSDNSAADTLIHLLGRNRIEARVRSAGHSRPERMTPFLTTVEAFALKGDNFAEQRSAFLAGDEAQQAAVIDQNQGQLVLANVDGRSVTGAPRFIDSLEWFASPMDIARLMADIRKRNSPTVLSVLAINPGVGQTAAESWSYLGYKGGSEAGVISMSLLGQRKADGKWLVITASWNDRTAAVNGEKFHALVTRLVDLAARPGIGSGPSASAPQPAP